ncbi:MAG: di-trans,poly-cis-decaprenylcistransferase [SAR324 cluster bacterium]|nr:di-trans,poly-cis-decaprenylcistransferase [SAR324 cluster bacterium]
MDGNGRWASLRQQSRTFGHRRAEKAIRNSVNYCLANGVLALTLYAFSTENWQRSKREVAFIMTLLLDFLKKSRQLLMENQIKLAWIGRRDKIPKEVRALFEEIIEQTKHHQNMTLCLAVDYGSKGEIMSAIKKITSLVKSGDMQPAEVSENLLESMLDTKDLPPLDLLVRTSGEFRLSNFLLWQAAYAELYFCDTLWPDFDEKELAKAFASYSARSRRWGKIMNFI